jgi:hypothetical protein
MSWLRSAFQDELDGVTQTLVDLSALVSDAITRFSPQISKKLKKLLPLMIALMTFSMNLMRASSTLLLANNL